VGRRGRAPASYTDSVEEGAALFELLVDLHRPRMMTRLARHAEASVAELSRAVGQCPTTASHHRKLQRRDGLVDYRREGNSNRYSLASAVARHLLRHVKGAAARCG
jgi:DNA-binding transcriptional ArsR family regulator